jgi:HK97 family phage major capsid protein
MTKNEYLEQRNSLINHTQALLNEDKLDAAEDKMKEIEDLDQRFETVANARANFRALQGNSVVRDLSTVGFDVSEGDFIAGPRMSMGIYNHNDFVKENQRMNNSDEIKAFQQYVSLGGDMRAMSDRMRNALTTGASGAFLPVDIFERMITDEKYSDLLRRATVINAAGAGTIKIPIADAHEASWKEEGDGVSPTNPTLSSIDLGGMELMRAIQYSAAVDAMSIENFSEIMAGLVSSELVETLEKAFISGSISAGQPHNGLEYLDWTLGVNLVEAGSSNITPEDVAKGLSLLPQKYNRNAVLLMNANTAYNTVDLFKGTSEYAYNLADGVSRFMGREIVISEHCSSDSIFIVDPVQLYVRFAMRPSVSVNRSVGFLSATTSMRCLAVVDYAWNSTACVKVAKKA